MEERCRELRCIREISASLCPLRIEAVTTETHHYDPLDHMKLHQGFREFVLVDVIRGSGFINRITISSGSNKLCTWVKN